MNFGWDVNEFFLIGLYWVCEVYGGFMVGEKYFGVFELYFWFGG